MNVQNKRVLVVGMARSGVAVAQLLCKHGAKVIVNDNKTREELGEALAPLANLPVEWALGCPAGEVLEGVDVLVISPGISINAGFVKKAAAMGIHVTGELEVASQLSQGRMVAITGTNGKTTTVSLLGEIFKNAGKTTHVVGNIGIPYTGAVPGMKPGDVTVCEISSFMMETSSKFHPQVSAVLNISEDHLNRHGTMENYIALKERIFENSTAADTVVLNWDDPVTRAMAEHTKAKIAWFSSREEVEFGAFVRDGMIVFGDKRDPKNICPAEEVYIPGEHNLKNALAASAMAMVAGVPAPVVRHTLKTFRGVDGKTSVIDLHDRLGMDSVVC